VSEQDWINAFNELASTSPKINNTNAARSLEGEKNEEKKSGSNELASKPSFIVKGKRKMERGLGGHRVREEKINNTNAVRPPVRRIDPGSRTSPSGDSSREEKSEKSGNNELASTSSEIGLSDDTSFTEDSPWSYENLEDKWEAKYKDALLAGAKGRKWLERELFYARKLLRYSYMKKVKQKYSYMEKVKQKFRQTNLEKPITLAQKKAQVKEEIKDTKKYIEWLKKKLKNLPSSQR
jgi:hypothetical protein